MGYTLGFDSAREPSNHSPGRFFAINEVKLMLASVILKYDFTTKDGVRPANELFRGSTMPDMSAKILFRKRQQSH